MVFIVFVHWQLPTILPKPSGIIQAVKKTIHPEVEKHVDLRGPDVHLQIRGQ